MQHIIELTCLWLFILSGSAMIIMGIVFVIRYPLKKKKTKPYVLDKKLVDELMEIKFDCEAIRN